METDTPAVSDKDADNEQLAESKDELRGKYETLSEFNDKFER